MGPLNNLKSLCVRLSTARYALARRSTVSLARSTSRERVPWCQ
jgi:hypothetical protein